MAPKPVHIFIDRKELIGYTDFRLKRSKDKMTGELSISVFMGWLPSEPVMGEAVRGSEVLVYIGGHLAFTGFIDRRRDTGARSGSPGTSRGDSSASFSTGPNEYTVRFTCRGKTKFLIDSSHQNQETTILRPTNRSVFGDLVRPWDIDVEWEADEIDLHRVRLRDGARVVDELQRVAEQCSLFVYETRDGKLKVVDGPGAGTGEAIALGANILSFSTDQAADWERSQVLVKGQRTEPGQWRPGEAILNTLKNVEDTTVAAFSPITVQHYGNATSDLLDRRAQYEANKRAAVAKRIQVEVFHVQQTDRKPWDLGVKHYVEIPPAGVFGEFEVVDLEYMIDNDKNLKTSLTLAPVPIKKATGGSAKAPLSSLPEVVDDPGISNKAKVGADKAFTEPWQGPRLQEIDLPSDTKSIDKVLDGVKSVGAAPPSSLPENFAGGAG